jgi:hypothetical protein
MEIRGVANTKISALRDAIAETWSRRFHMSKTVLFVPIGARGLGARPSISAACAVSIPRAPSSAGSFRLAQTKIDAVTDSMTSYGLPLAPGEAVAMLNFQLSKTVAADSAPSIARLLRSEVKRTSTHVYPVTVDRYFVKFMRSITARFSKITTLFAAEVEHVNNPPLFGSCSHLTQYWRDIESLASVRHVDRWRLNTNGEITRNVLLLGRMGFSRKDAIDICMGDFSPPKGYGMPDSLSHTVGRLWMREYTAIARLKLVSRERSILAALVADGVARAASSMAWFRKLGGW